MPFISSIQTRRWYVIRNLTAGARYVVKLQALSSIGGGANVAVDIQTPDIKIQVNPGKILIRFILFKGTG